MKIEEIIELSKKLPYKTIEEMQVYIISKALKKTKGNRCKASKLLGISERSLYTKIIQFEIEL